MSPPLPLGEGHDHASHGARGARGVRAWPNFPFPLHDEQSWLALPTRKSDRYFCQSTELTAVTRVFPPRNLRTYWHHLMNGEVPLLRLARILGLSLLNKFRWAGWAWPLAASSRAVRKSRPRAIWTFSPANGLRSRAGKRSRPRWTRPAATVATFEAEMLIHCGRRYRVAFQVRRIINEETARLVELTNTVVLDGVTCQGICAKNCPRSNYFYCARFGSAGCRVMLPLEDRSDESQQCHLR